MSTLLRRKILILAVCVVGAVAMFALSGDNHVQARLMCRSDPVVLLSDGTVLDISADIGTPLWRVQSVHYTLNIPEGLKVVKSISTPNWPTTTEKFRIRATNLPGRFTTSVLVYTSESNVPVTANFLLNTTFKQKQGLSGEKLTLSIRR